MQPRGLAASNTASASDLKECIVRLHQHGYTGLGPHVGLRIRYSKGDVSNNSGCSDIDEKFVAEVTKQLPFPECDDNPYLRHVSNCFETINHQLGTVWCIIVDSIEPSLLYCDVMYRDPPRSCLS